MNSKIPEKYENKNVVYAERGTTGTENYAGYFSEDHITSFDGLSFINVVDRMKRSDGQMYKLLNEVKRPIKKAKFNIEPCGDEDEQKLHADYIKAAIFDQFSWQDYLENALTHVDYGFAVFEIVHKIIDHKIFGKMACIKKMGFRKQKTIEKWNFGEKSKEFESIRQLAYGDLRVDTIIPAQNLQVLTYLKEGDNFEGNPPTRPCYRDWTIKKELWNIQRRGLSFSATGIPVIYLASDDAQVVAKCKEAIEKFVKGENQGLILPKNLAGKSEIGELKSSHDAEKLNQCIRLLDGEMAEAFSAGFTELGRDSGGGSYAQAQVKIDLFLDGLQSIAEQIIEDFNMRFIPQMIDWKFGEQDEYPKMQVSGIKDLKGKERSEQLTRLAGANLIQVSDKVMTQIHEEFNLPDYDVDLAKKQKKEKEKGSSGENDDSPPNSPTPEEPTKKGKDKQKEKKDDQEKEPEMNEHKKKGCCDLEHDIELAENVHPAIKIIAKGQTKVEETLNSQMEKRADSFISILESKLKKGKSKTNLLNTEIPGKGKFKNEMMRSLGITAVHAKDQVIKELKLNRKVGLDEITDQIKALPASVKADLNTEVDLMTRDLDGKLYSSIAFAITKKLKETDNLVDVVIAARKASSEFLNSGTMKVAPDNFASRVVNGVRNDFFQEDDVLAGIAAFRFTNASPVSAICVNLAGTIFSVEEYRSTSFLPPLHHRCKSIIEPILVGSKDIPDFTRGGLLLPKGDDDQIKKAIKSIKF